jgi:hypothetical protein
MYLQQINYVSTDETNLQVARIWSRVMAILPFSSY